jgi:hypothetical protein
MDDLSVKTVSIKELLKELSEKGEEYFKRQYNCPFLILLERPVKNGTSTSLKVKTEGSGKIPSPSGASLKSRLVLPLRKTGRNAYTSRLTIGRAPNNDLYIDSSKISRLHAMIIDDDRKEAFSVMDMGSANGTFVNDVRLEPRKTVTLSSGDRLRLWRMVFEFHTPDGMIAYLKKMR